MGAPVGNQNGAKGKQWADAVKRAIRTKYGKEWDESLEELAKGLVEAAAAGDLQALKEVGDRLDGKPKQQTEISGPDGEAIPMRTVVNFVAPGGS
jgi:HPt (histidine-containing phosphotransfer) domain-containing protein